jgi:hypothetical protein
MTTMAEVVALGLAGLIIVWIGLWQKGHRR